MCIEYSKTTIEQMLDRGDTLKIKIGEIRSDEKIDIYKKLEECLEST